MEEGQFLPRRLPLVGRDEELARMQAALDRLMGGQGRLLLISGEPGIGKTRLVEELAALALDQGALVAWGRVDEVDGAPPYWPWVQIIDRVLDGGDEQMIGEALDTDAGPIGALVPRVKEMVAEITPPRLLDPLAARFRLHQAIVDFLGRISVHRRLVVVLEDFHWADVASLELSRFLAARLSTIPVLLVLTLRTVDAGDAEGLGEILGSLARIPTLERIALEGLNVADVGRFMTQTIGLRPRPAVVNDVHARTEGNPFFVSELARLLPSEGLWAAAGSPGGAEVPVEVRDVVRRRLDRLPKQTRELLVLGAVVGREFDLAVLAVAAEMGEGQVVDAVEPALSAGLIVEALGTAPRFRFSHALIRDTVYGELSVVRRASLHAQVGIALEGRQGDARSQAAELAGHFFHAAPVLGPGRGLAYTLEAAKAAQAAVAYERAEDDLRRALSLIELFPASSDRSVRELQVQNRLVVLMTATRGHASAEVGQASARARDLCLGIGETDELYRALVNLAGFHLTHGDLSIVEEVAAQLLTVGEQATNKLWLAAGNFCLGAVQLHTGRLLAAQQTLSTGRQAADDSELSAEVADSTFGLHILPTIVMYLARLAWVTGKQGKAEAFVEEGIELATRTAHPATLAFVWYVATHLRVVAGDAAVTLAWADRAIVLCTEHNLVTLQDWLMVLRGWALAELGRAEEGVAEMRAALIDIRASGARINMPIFLGLLADGEAHLGQQGRALELVDEALAVSGEDQLWQSDLYRRRGVLIAAQGPDHAGEAGDSLRKAQSIANAQGAVAFEHRAEAALLVLQQTEMPGAARPQPFEGDSSSLSPRELELLTLVGRGLTDKQIARDLMISLTTVRSHLDRIRDKTGQRRRAELTRLAVTLGLSVGGLEKLT